jgi:putative protease
VEILAPAGSTESLEAAVRTGADAVYLGGRNLNARRGAANFDEAQLAGAVRSCHIRGVKVYQTINTIVYANELSELAGALETAHAAGVDALIVQDLAVAALARRYTPALELHASTQMAVHNLDGVKMLEELGFRRVVLARELTLTEIAAIAGKTAVELEVFVHGALCMCVSGQCYLSAMIGGRSGNRGLCAQPCRLPFRSQGSDYALSLKDLSALEKIPELTAAGVASLKIEGRLKRPEYVAAAVRACRQARDGDKPDIEKLRAVFSRSGFTCGYLEDRRGDEMFGTRQKEDVTAAGAVLKGLARLYAKERQAVPVDFRLTARAGEALRLHASDRDGHTAYVEGSLPVIAERTPTTPERVRLLLEKTGGTPFLAGEIDCDIQEGLLIPASAINQLRRMVLEDLAESRGATERDPVSIPLPAIAPGTPPAIPALRARLAGSAQLTPYLLEKLSMISLPPEAILSLDPAFIAPHRDKLAVELPRIHFREDTGLDERLERVKALGVTHLVAGNLWAIRRGWERGFVVHGDAFLNIANAVALEEYERMGLADATLSFELTLERARQARGSLPTGLLAYGFLPLMATRNPPAGTGRTPDSVLVDRLGNRFALMPSGDVTALLNMVPLYLADRLRELRGFDFLTLYFTKETPVECDRILAAYLTGKPTEEPKTRGLYYRK